MSSLRTVRRRGSPRSQPDAGPPLHDRSLLLTWRRHRLAPLAQCAVGASLLGWLMIQIPLVGYATMFQVPYTALALGLIALNVRHVKTW